MFKKFLNDRLFMLNYAITNFLYLSIICLFMLLYSNTWTTLPLFMIWIFGLILFVLPNFSLIFLSSIYYVVLFYFTPHTSYSHNLILLIPLGLYCGTLSAAIMHNSSHNSIYPKWTNRIWGEFCGILQISGFAGWYVAHMLHHGNPDHPEKDPHPPGELTFIQFANSMGTMMKKALTDKFFYQMGDTNLTRQIWLWVAILSPVNRFLRVFFILLLLGPSGFIFFYVPFKLANTLIYADFNYRTHRPQDSGGYEIININHNGWYKFLNMISCGSYFHKNHHKSPTLFNPKNMATKENANHYSMAKKIY